MCVSYIHTIYLKYINMYNIYTKYHSYIKTSDTNNLLKNSTTATNSVIQGDHNFTTVDGRTPAPPETNRTL